MPFDDLQAFVRHLEQHGQLKRVRVEVDPELEATALTEELGHRLQRKGQALLLDEAAGEEDDRATCGSRAVPSRGQARVRTPPSATSIAGSPAGRSKTGSES